MLNSLDVKMLSSVSTSTLNVTVTKTVLTNLTRLIVMVCSSQVQGVEVMFLILMRLPHEIVMLLQNKINNASFHRVILQHVIIQHITC